VSESCTALYRGLWAQILGALDPGTDLYAAVLAIAPASWDAFLTEGTETDERSPHRLARDFPAWCLWRPSSPDGGAEPWWGARDGRTVIIMDTAAGLRSALEAHIAGDTNGAPVEVFFFDRRRES
jgi:hypothetical protein